MYDVSIIGAGVVGSAIARELSKYDLSISLIEKESDVSTGASKANTGIVHGGYVAKAGTLKGELCIKGNALYEDLNDDLHFGYKNTGGVVLAFNKEDEETLKDIYQNALKVGHSEDDIEIIYGDKIKEIEPHVSDEATAAFYCKSIGVTSPFEMTIALAENAVDNGVDLKLDSDENVSKNKLSNFIQLTDLIIGVNRVAYIKISKNAAGQKECLEEFKHIIEHFTNSKKAYNKNNDYYKKFALQFFPTKDLGLTKDELKNKGINYHMKRGKFYFERDTYSQKRRKNNQMSLFS